MYEKHISKLEYFFSLLLILEGNSVFNVYKGHYMFNYLCCLSVFLVLLYIVIKKEIRISGLTLILFVYMGVFMSIQTVVHGVSLYRITEFVLCLPFCVIYFDYCLRNNRLFELFRKISNIIFILSVIANILWLVGPIYKLISPDVHISQASWGPITNYNGYYYLLFEAQQEDGTFLDKGTVWRNSSIFAEAPMFILWASISLYYEMFLHSKMRVRRLVIYFISILTAMSSTGIILLALLILCKGFKFFQEKRNIPIYTYILLGICMVGAYYVTNYVLGEKSSTSSYESRNLDYVIGFTYFLENPWAGAGFIDVDAEDVGSSNTIVTALAKGGVLVGLMMIVPLIIMITKGILHRDNTKLSTGVYFLYLYTTIVISHNFLFVVAMGFCFVMSLFRPNQLDIKDHVTLM